MSEEKTYKIKHSTLKRTLTIVAVFSIIFAIGFTFGNVLAYDSSQPSEITGKGIYNFSQIGTSPNPIENIFSENGTFSNSLFMPDNTVKTSELDETISPTWTGLHTFDNVLMDNLGSSSNPLTLINTEQISNVKMPSTMSELSNALSGGNAYVKLQPGSYILSSEKTVKSNTVLDLRNCTVRLADGADVNMFDITGENHITILGGELDGNRANQTVDNVTHVKAISSEGDSHYITIRDVYIHDVVNACINFSLSPTNSHIHISNNYLDQNYSSGESGFKPAEDVIEVKYGDKVTVANNYIAGSYVAGLELERTTNATVTANIFDNLAFRDSSSAFNIESADGPQCKNITFESNLIKNFHFNAITVYGGREVSIDGNVIEETDSSDIALVTGTTTAGSTQNLTISNNVFSFPNNTSVIGVRIKEPLSGLEIVNNNVYGGFEGIKIESQTNALLNGNRVNVDGTAYKIFSNSTSCVIKNNIAENCTKGFTFDNSTGNRFLQNEMFNCSWRDITLGASSGNNTIWLNNFTGTVQDDAGSQDFRWNEGYATESSGVASKSNGDTIAHGLDETPSIEDCSVRTASSNRAYITSVDGTNITIALEDTSGSAVATDENIYWTAKRHEG